MHTPRPHTAKSRNGKSGYEKNYPKCPERDDLLCVDCATCGKELVGLTHAAFAHVYNLGLAHFIKGRPYCNDCKHEILAKRFFCKDCDKKIAFTESHFVEDVPYCTACADSPGPARGRPIYKHDYSRPIGLRGDAHECTRRPADECNDEFGVMAEDAAEATSEAA